MGIGAAIEFDEARRLDDLHDLRIERAAVEAIPGMSSSVQLNARLAAVIPPASFCSSSLTRAGLALPWVARMTWPTKEAIELVAAGAVFGDLVGVGGRAPRRSRPRSAPESVTWRSPFASTIARGIGAGCDHFGEDVLGEPAGDRAVGDQVDQCPQLLGRDRRRFDARRRAGSTRRTNRPSPNWPPPWGRARRQPARRTARSPSRRPAHPRHRPTSHKPTRNAPSSRRATPASSARSRATHWGSSTSGDRSGSGK